MIIDYVKKIKKDNEDSLKYIQYKDKVHDDPLRSAIESNYDLLVKSYIENTLKSENIILYDKWNNKIIDLVKKSISLVSPSFKYLNDTMNINDYIKIKILPYKDTSLSRVIDGYAMQKNVCSKKMRTNIENPSILIINGGLDCGSASVNNFDKFFIQEPVYVEQMRKKIELIDVDIIIVNKNIVQNLQDQLIKKKNISMILNVKQSSLKKIARCNKTKVLDDIDNINTNVHIGHCKQFKIEKIRDKNNSTNINDMLKSKEYNLMLFEGCDGVLFNTILLSGSDITELRAIKRILKKSILPTVRDFFLQKSLLYYSYIDIPRNFNKNVNTNPIDIDLTNQNSSLSLIHSYSVNDDLNMSQVLNNESSISFITNQNKRNKSSSFKMLFDEEGIIIHSTKLNLIKITLTVNRSISNINILNDINEDNDISESEILKRVYQQCSPPEDIDIRYYDDKQDKPLGKLLIELSHDGSMKCSKCKRYYNKHVYHLYSNTGRISIMNISSKQYNIDKIVDYILSEDPEYNKSKEKTINYDGDIYSYGYCKICNAIVTPLIRLPLDMYNISSGKYFRFMLYNTEAKNRSDKNEYNISNITINTCSHYSFFDIDRVFITQYGNIVIGYSRYDKYKIESITHNEKKEMAIMKSISNNSINFAKAKMIKVIEYIGSLLSVANEECDIIKVANSNIISSISKLKNIINMCNISLNEFKNHVETNFTSETSFTYIKAQVIISKIYIKLIQYKVISNEIRACINRIKKYQMLLSMITQSQSSISTEPSLNDKLSVCTPSFNLLERPSILSQCETTQSSNNELQFHYKYIVDYVSFIDDSHSSNMTHIKIGDYSSIIGYALMSDKYRSVIRNKSKFDLTSIKCERKTEKKIDIVDNEDILTMKSENALLHSKSDNNIANNMYNYFTVNEVYFSESSMLFDANKNTYYNSTMEKSKILQQLETELLNDEKNNFVYSIKTMKNINKVLSIKVGNEEIRNSRRLHRQMTEMNISNIFQRKSGSDFDSATSNEENEVFSIKVSPIIKSGKMKKAMSNDTNVDLFLSSASSSNNDIAKYHEEIDSIGTDIKIEKQKLFSENNIGNSDYANKIKSKLSSIKINTYEDNIIQKQIDVTVYFSRQFEALRITYCATYDEYLSSIAKSHIWDSVSGGKSKASFLKSVDNKYIFKLIKKDEFRMFCESAFQYFHHIAKHLFHKMPSMLAKIVGVYKIKITTKSSQKTNMVNYVENVVGVSDKTEKIYVIVMENANIDNNKQYIRTYDLKGSNINRYIKKKNMKNDQVLLDTNFKEDRNGDVIVIDKASMEILASAVHNDSLFLSKINVIDYSMLLIKNDNDKTLRMKIIDYIRKYTWDKQLERVGKTIINGLNAPTIISPNDYKERFKKVITDFFIGI